MENKMGGARRHFGSHDVGGDRWCADRRAHYNSPSLKLGEIRPMELTMNRFIHVASIRGLMTSPAILIGSGSAFAVDLKFYLTGAQETPPVTTLATGTGTITIAADKSVSGTI